MQVFPSTVSASTKSAGERKIFTSFQKTTLKGQAFCFHSLRLSEHQYKREGELDFVLVTPEGIFILEVKGGNIRRDEEGNWLFTDRYGVNRKKNEGPFTQASIGMHSLLKMIKDHFGNNRISDMAYGYGVIFPDCKFNIKSPEWSTDTILDASHYKSGESIAPFLINLIKYWRTKGLNSNAPILDANEVQQLCTYLRPKFDMAPSLAQRAEDLDREMTSLTQEQYEKLDGMQLNPRILCSGGAGTGKTFLAIEVARRHTEQQKTVLLVCRSEILASFLKARCTQGITVRSIENLKDVKPHDVLIIDEGQDLLNLENLITLDHFLIGGLEKGVWRIFYDVNNQSGIYGSYDPESFNMLISFNPAFYELHRNCRNTQNIVTQTRLLTAADLGKPSAGDGPAVSYLYYSGEDKGLNILESEIKRLLADDVPLSDITILSPSEFSESVTSRLPIKILRELAELTVYNAHLFPGKNLTFSTIKNFKGLENKFIFLVDIDSDQISNQSIVYVAMTRARVGLTFILNDNIRPQVKNTSLKNISLIGA